MTQRYDAIILGAGPAGLTAAICLARARLRPLVLDTAIAGGQMVLSYEVANYPGVEATSGRAIGQTMLRQAKGFGARVITQATILRTDLTPDLKVVEVEDEGVFEAPAVIVATGGVPRKLGVPGEARFDGTGISYCATCDGDFFTGRPIAVIGGGNSALEEAVSLTKYASKVTVIHEFEEFQAQRWAVSQARANPKIELMTNQRIVAFEGSESLEGVATISKDDGKRRVVPVDGAFVFIGYVPATEQFRGVLDLDERGQIVADESLATSVEGVFVAGDARAKRYRQITTAVADGTVAALSAVEYVERRHARDERARDAA